MKKIIGVSGHRPDKLGGYTDEVFNSLVQTFEEWLSVNSVKRVVTGMALGWDQAVAQACINRKMPFWAAVPFTGQERKWFPKSIELYKNLLAQAEKVIVVSEGGYAPYKMHVRNKFIIDNCDKLVVMWNGDQFGGTWGCIKYARSKGFKEINLFDDWQDLTRDPDPDYWDEIYRYDL